jgi:tetratricopeptide (TPR) repeat protein
MARRNLDDTQPIKINSEPKSGSLADTQSIKARKKPRRWKVILIGILAILIFALAGGGLGYLHGINQRLARERETVLGEAALHFQYGLQDMAAGNYARAKTQLEYVLKIYPDFPDAKEKYTETLVQLAASGNSTSPDVLVTPTPDTRGAEVLFNQAVGEVQTQQWAAAMQTLTALRDTDYTYRTLEVDGMFFTTLRHRAIELIVNEGNLEEGLYFLAIAEKYMVPDRDAVNYAQWARLYLTGASFWDIDWSQVVNYFGQLTGAFPYLHDGTGWTATDRYLKGSENYGDQLAGEGDHCEAIQQYQNVLNYGENETVLDKYNASYLKCYPPTATPAPIPTEDELATEVPTEEATVEPTAEPTPTT